jgi:hypothetical protein
VGRHRLDDLVARRVGDLRQLARGVAGAARSPVASWISTAAGR